MKNKLFKKFIVAFVVIFCAISFSGCIEYFETIFMAIENSKDAYVFNEANEALKEDLIKKAANDGNYVIQNEYVFKQGSNEVNVAAIARKRALGDGLITSDYQMKYAYFCVDSFVYFVIEFSETSRKNNCYMLMIVDLNDIFKDSFFDYMGGFGSFTGIGYIEGGYIINYSTHKVFNMNSKKVTSLAEIDKKYYRYDHSIINGRLVFSSLYDMTFVIFDNQLQYKIITFPNAEIDFITGDYVLFSNGKCYDLKFNQMLLSESKLKIVMEEYEVYKQSNNHDATEKTSERFVYNGELYRWENIWVEDKSETTLKFKSILVITCIDDNQVYTFDYDEIHNVNEDVYNAYSIMPFAQVFVENGELFVVCGWDSDEDKTASLKIVFRLDELTNRLEYVGVTSMKNGVVNRVHKLTN